MKNDDWHLAVLRLIREGLGVEDIAHVLECDTDDVRKEVRILRLNGVLDRMFGSR